ncbi:MAG: hypothetical protein J6Z82_00620 [Schwartzia sp.]|nr:hypothetical protein [Schwartzia sp. (in: firmicutes)]
MIFKKKLRRMIRRNERAAPSVFDEAEKLTERMPKGAGLMDEDNRETIRICSR